MKRLLSAIGLIALLVALAAPAGTLAASGAKGAKCPSILDGQGGYAGPNSGYAVPEVAFTVYLGDLATNLPMASCSSSTYTITVQPTDASGAVLAGAPILSQTWKGDNKSTSFSLPLTAMPGAPAGVCISATIYQGSWRTDYAPADGSGCRLYILDGGAGGSGFRG